MRIAKLLILIAFMFAVSSASAALFIQQVGDGQEKCPIEMGCDEIV